jgi:hypothetical protein
MPMTSSAEPTTWFGIIFAPGRRWLTISIGAFIAAITVLSLMLPAATPWLAVAGGLVAILWLTRMMTLYRNANRHTRQ